MSAGGEVGKGGGGREAGRKGERRRGEGRGGERGRDVYSQLYRYTNVTFSLEAVQTKARAHCRDELVLYLMMS